MHSEYKALALYIEKNTYLFFTVFDCLLSPGYRTPEHFRILYHVSTSIIYYIVR